MLSSNGPLHSAAYVASREWMYDSSRTWLLKKVHPSHCSAALCKGPFDESIRYRDFMGLDMPWYSVEKTAPQLLVGRDWQRHHPVCYVRAGDRVFETYYTGGRGVEIMSPTHGLLDMTVYGRQETWEDSPDGWPQPWGDAKNPQAVSYTHLTLPTILRV